MADSDLPTLPTEGQRLYSAWRIARANWELARHDPGNLGADLPDDVDAAHCDSDHDALMAYLLHPAASLHELSRKLRTFNEEDGSGLTRSREIAAALAKDAQSLLAEEAYGHGRDRVAKVA